MELLISKLLPILVYFLVGISARRFGLVSAEHGNIFIKFSFYYTLPALIFASISKTRFTSDLLFLPLSGIAVVMIVFCFAHVVAKLRQLAPNDKGTLILGAMAMNGAYAFPFLLVFFGPEALTYAVLFDLGNAIMVFTVCYVVAFHYGENKTHGLQILKNIVSSPLLWTVAIAILMSVLEISMPVLLAGALDDLGHLTAPMLLIGMGINFSPARHHIKPALDAVGLRMLGGLTAILLVVMFLEVDSTEQKVAMLLCAASPLGMTSVSYSILAGLNTKILTSAVSISILIGMVWLPLLAYFYL